MSGILQTEIGDDMGYSCTVHANYSYDALLGLLKRDNPEITSTNTWKRNGETYFAERGRENFDGAITGVIYMFSGESCRKAGSYRIEPNGHITRFATSTKLERHLAYEYSDKKYNEVFVIKQY